MHKKLVFIVTFSLLIDILGIASKVPQIRASGTIYIRADGSVDPPTAILSSDNITYTLTSDTEYSLVIQRNNIILDGSGHIMQWFEGTGILLSGINNVTIKNLTIKEFNCGIFIEGSSAVCILGNNIDGMYVYGKSSSGILLSYYSNYITILGNNITNCYYCIELSFSSNNSILGNKIRSDYYGILLDNSLNNSILGNYVTGLSAGIYLMRSSHNIISENTICAYSGIKLFADENSIFDNCITNSSYGIELSGFRNSVFKNNLVSNYYGIFLDGSENIIYANNITRNYCGIYIYTSPFLAAPNVFYYNNFVSNTCAHVYIKYQRRDIWDNGYPLGGNYWSDYTGTDTDFDGIGYPPYKIDLNNIDHYPLMGVFSSFSTSLAHCINVLSNSTIEDFDYFEFNHTIRMRVSNMTASQSYGFCRLTIPHVLLSPPYSVVIDDDLVPYIKVYENETLSIIYFSYQHSTLDIIIVQEFPSPIVLLLFMIATMLMFTIYLRKHPTVASSEKIRKGNVSSLEACKFNSYVHAQVAQNKRSL